MLIDHVFASETTCRRAPAAGKLFDYMVAGNGVFVRARREGLAAQIPVALTQRRIAGLPTISTYVATPARVPARHLQVMLDCSKVALPNEMLFSLHFEKCWRLYVPSQVVTAGSVHPADAFDGEFAKAVMEVHSHNHMPAAFSAMDDQDETGFRLYAVLGKIDTAFPEINVRVGVYGHMAAIPARTIFEDLGSFIDVNER